MMIRFKNAAALLLLVVMATVNGDEGQSGGAGDGVDGGLDVSGNGDVDLPPGDLGDLSNFGGVAGEGTGGNLGFDGGGFDDPSSGAGNPFGGMDQTDDFASTLGSLGPEMVKMMFGQCLENIDMAKIAEDPFADVSNLCNSQQATTFNNALSTFETCAGFDLKALIENFASIFVGIALNCGSYGATLEDHVDDILTRSTDSEQLKAQESPLPRVPDACVNALLGNNPFGQAFLYSEEFPEREQQCFMELAGKLPKCTLDEWPIPIVGSWLSALSCIYGSTQDVLMPMIQETLTGELQQLNQCIPEKITAANCKGIRNKCVFESGGVPSTAMMLPPPFWNPPMSQRCKDTATSSGMDDLSDRYEAFRQTCIPPADLLVWDIAASHQDEHAGTEGGGASYMAKATETPPSSDVAPSDGALTSVVFAKGLFAGMVVAFVGMFGFSKVRRNRSRRPIGDDFDSLELAENREFT